MVQSAYQLQPVNANPMNEKWWLENTDYYEIKTFCNGPYLWVIHTEEFLKKKKQQQNDLFPGIYFEITQQEQGGVGKGVRDSTSLSIANSWALIMLVNTYMFENVHN